MLQGGSNAQIDQREEGYETGNRSDEDHEGSSYVNNYSLKGTAMKHPHHVKIGLPLSNNDMHLHGREVAMASPTISRYSAAN